ncbi:MAG: YdjY domain-containing protein [Planctomycetota bacterium]|nr:YdjY domain-containing protein [Planctomycetota bacterium]
MEPLRTKRCLVLLVVFALALGITPACKPREGDKPSPSGKESAKPSASAEESRTQTEGDVSKPAAADAPQMAAGEKVLTPTPTVVESNTTAGVPDGDKPGDTADNTNGAGAAAGAEAESAKAIPPEAEAADDIPRDETPQETARRLGPPLVEQHEKLLRLDKVKPIWLDKPAGRLVMVGEVCQREAPLEMFVCLWHTKEHESVLSVRVPAKTAHAGLLALGAKAGNPVRFMPKYVPAAGSVIDIEVIFKGAKGKIHKRRGQDWIRDFRTKKPMQEDWVFGGSGFWTDKKTGQTHYQAQSGDFICVSNFSTAMLDLPVKSTHSNEGLMFEALTESIPPLGTPVTIVLKPRLTEQRADKPRR